MTKTFKNSKQYNQQKEIFENRNHEAIQRFNKRDKMEKGFFKFLFGDNKQEWPKGDGLPVTKVNLKTFLAESAELKVIWFGHSTFLLNIQGKIVLIDPVFSDYASPIPLFVKRFQKTPLSLEEMPKIDYIVISHDHYDHLDIKSIKYFKQDSQTQFLVPLGVNSHLEGWGVNPKQIHIFDWWDAKTLDGIDFIATPAQHFSGRSFNDKNKTLWASWILKTEKENLFYSGDTGYDIHFKEIGDKYGPFDLAFIENGQYNKSWEEVHLLPEQGVKAFEELNAKAFFPVHWGGFKLSYHSWFEPIENVYSSSKSEGFRLIAPEIGKIVTLDESYKQDEWWRRYITRE